MPTVNRLVQKIKIQEARVIVARSQLERERRGLEVLLEMLEAAPARGTDALAGPEHGALQILRGLSGEHCALPERGMAPAMEGAPRRCAPADAAEAVSG